MQSVVKGIQTRYLAKGFAKYLLKKFEFRERNKGSALLPFYT